MADAIPVKLRQADITRYINRANQLRSVKPAITYWCEYWVVNQILAKQLHNADDECLNYTTNLMDGLEQTKIEHANDETILDDVAGQAFVEQFAQQTFERAERVLRANKVTRQTADTFDAAATFLSLMAIWGQIDPETQQKIKFAKWNATRILKAIKEGKDPNESNPKMGNAEVGGAEAGLPPLDPEDPEVKRLQQTASPAPVASSSSALAARPATVEDVPEGRDGDVVTGYFDPPQPSPLSTPHHETASASDPLPGVSPELPSVLPVGPSSPPHVPPQIPVKAPQQQSMSPPFVPSPAAATPIHAQPQSSWQAPVLPTASQYSQPSQPSYPPPHQPPFVPAMASHPAPSPYAPPPPQAWQPPPPLAPAAERNISLAQKHAKWAVSALNFDDVPTAVKELRMALAALGVND